MNNIEDVRAPRISSDGGVLALDGGFGSLLEHIGYNVNVKDHELWSGGANIDDPDLVLRSHKLFIEAGADVIMTNTYHCSIQKMIDAKGYTLAQAEDVLKKAVEIAKRAIHESRSSDRQVTLVGTIGPYATYLRDASEYSGNYTKKPGFQKQNDTETRSGDLFADVARTAASIAGVECVGVNCTAPGHVTSLLKSARKVLADLSTKPAFVVYPNSGEFYNTAINIRKRCAHYEIAAQVPHWRALGARIIGGCCRVLPPQIRAIANACHLDNSDSAKN